METIPAVDFEVRGSITWWYSRHLRLLVPEAQRAPFVISITPITFWYVWEGEKRKKTVYYFLMKYVGGDITKHDDEMSAIEWLPKNKVLGRLTYKGDKDAYNEALPLIEALLINSS